MGKKIEKIDYGNWMARKLMVIGSFFSLVLVLLTIFVPVLWLRIITGILGVIEIMMTAVAFMGYYTFSPKGNNLQETVNNLVIDHLEWDGRGVCLDIGCGNAPLSVKIAKKYPEAKVIASDYWGETQFNFDEKQCQINAKLENVQNQIEFKHANAAGLPFGDESIDAIVSNLVFHEVKDFKMKEKHKAVLEALRVLKPGGVFAFQDLFGSKPIYGDFETLQNNLQGEVSTLHYYDTLNELNLPKWLNTPTLLGGLGIFYGIK